MSVGSRIIDSCLILTTQCIDLSSPSNSLVRLAVTEKETGAPVGSHLPRVTKWQS